MGKKLSLDQWKTIATIWAAIAGPIVLAVFGFWVQRTIADQSASTAYVQIAAQILQTAEREDGKGRDLRQWAARVLDKYSAEPLTEPAKEQLAQGWVGGFEEIDRIRTEGQRRTYENMVKGGWFDPPLQLTGFPDEPTEANVDAMIEANFRAAGINAVRLEAWQKLGKSLLLESDGNQAAPVCEPASSGSPP